MAQLWIERHGKVMYFPIPRSVSLFVEDRRQWRRMASEPVEYYAGGSEFSSIRCIAGPHPEMSHGMNLRQASTSPDSDHL